MKRYKPYLMLSFIIIIVGILYMAGRQNQLIMIEKPEAYNDQWLYEDELINLPFTVNVQKEQWYSIEKELDSSFHHGQVMLVRTSLSNIRVSVDQDIIYEKIYGTNLQEPFASTWHFISIPENSEGKTLHISYYSPYQAMAGQINDIFIGDQAMHYAYIYRTYGARVILSTLIFVIGFSMMIADFFISKAQEKGYVYAGMFAVILSLWMFAESRMLQFFTGSPLFIGSLAYLVLPLILLPLIAFLRAHVLVKYKHILTFFIPIFFLQFFFVITAYFVGWYDFFETVTITQILLGITIVVSIVLLLMEIKLYHNQNALKFIKAFSFLIIFAFFEFLGFAFNDFENTSVYISIGLGILMVGLLYNYIKYIMQRLKMSYEKEFYEKLAYMDFLTKGYNRLAFERDLDEAFTEAAFANGVRLIMFDLDGLKKVNDVYGHLKGDEAIIKAYDVISSTFSQYGQCYRIGGDEFACLCQNLNDETYQQLKKELLKKTKQIEEETEYHFGLSVGTATNKLSIHTAFELMHYADMDMYVSKDNEGLSSR